MKQNKLALVYLSILLSADLSSKQAPPGGNKPSHSGNYGSHPHHSHINYDPSPVYDGWYYDWSRPRYYEPSYLAPRPYVPVTPYRPLYPEYQYEPQLPIYPNTSLYLPSFTLTTDTPMVHVGDQVNIFVKIEKGVPPFTVFWQNEEDTNWISGGTTFTYKADKRGISRVTAILRDLNEQVSNPQKIQIIVLSKEDTNTKHSK